MIFVVGCVFPAFAEVRDIFYPKDYIYSYDFDGINASVVYFFDTTPLLSVLDRGSGNSLSNLGSVSVSNLSSPSYVFRAFPLGLFNNPTQDDPSGVVDVTDFKSKAVFDLSGVLTFDVQYAYYGTAAYESLAYFNTYTYVSFYDELGGFISSKQSDVHRHDLEFSIPENGDEKIGFAIPLDVKFSLDIPDNAVYMMPCILSYFYPPTDEMGHFITDVTASTNDFIIQAEKNVVIENSETMNAIKDKLGDLNNKVDTIVNGTPEQNQIAQENSELLEEYQTEMDDIFHRLDQFDHVDTASAMGAIQNFIDEDGWKDVRELISPILDWEHTVTIMLIVLSLINLSIILFGR